MHNFTFGGVGFKKSLEAFLRCQHCGQVLRQKRIFNTIVVFERKFYLFSFLMLAILAAIFFYLILLPLDPFFIISAILGSFVVFLLSLAGLTAKYAIWEESSEEELENIPKVEHEPQLAFINFTLITVVTGFLIFFFVSNSDIELWIFSAIIGIYLACVIIAGNRVLKKTKEALEKKANQVKE